MVVVVAIALMWFVVAVLVVVAIAWSFQYAMTGTAMGSNIRIPRRNAQRRSHHSRRRGQH